MYLQLIEQLIVIISKMLFKSPHLETSDTQNMIH